MCREQRDLLERLRAHNESALRPVHWYGVDQPGSNLALLPGIDRVLQYLDQVDPEYRVDPALRETAAAFAAASVFSAGAAFSAHAALDQSVRDALTAGLVVIMARLQASRPAYVRRSSATEFESVCQALRVKIAEDVQARDRLINVRDAAQADTVRWILERENGSFWRDHHPALQRHDLSDRPANRLRRCCPRRPRQPGPTGPGCHHRGPCRGSRCLPRLADRSRRRTLSAGSDVTLVQRPKQSVACLLNGPPGSAAPLGGD
ncbi:erythromycin esterase family protein [Nocardia coubleae]